MRKHSMILASAMAAAISSAQFLGAQRLDAQGIAAPVFLAPTPSGGKVGKHRNSGKGSPRPNYSHNGTPHCGAKQCEKYARQKPHGDEHEWLKRMAWLADPRIQAVMAKRAQQQAFGFTRWGRR